MDRDGLKFDSDDGFGFFGHFFACLHCFFHQKHLSKSKNNGDNFRWFLMKKMQKHALKLDSDVEFGLFEPLFAYIHCFFTFIKFSTVVTQRK